jgi:hypothetical protein
VAEEKWQCVRDPSSSGKPKELLEEKTAKKGIGKRAVLVDLLS